MDFVKSLSMFHVDAKEIPCVTGEGTPTMKTEGAPGVLYMDTLTGALYKCRAADYVNELYTWEAVEAGGSSDEPITLIDNAGLKIGPEGQMLSHEGSTNHIISQSIPVSAGERYRLTCSANFRNSLYAIYSGEADKANLLENWIAESTEGGSKIIAQEVVMPTGAKCMIVAWNKLVTDTPYAVVRVSQSTQAALPLAGQTVVVIGDSIVERNNKTSVNFCDHLTVNTGAEIVNMGVGGTGYMSGQDEEQAFYQRAAEIPDGVDRVLIYGSGNDRNMPLGEPTDTGTDTLCGCVNATLDVVHDRAPTAWVGVIAPAPWKDYPPFEEGNAMEKIAGALAAICRRRGVPYLDLYHSSGLRPWDEAFRTLAYSKDDGDGTHPDETGHAMIAPQIQAFLLGAVGSMVDTSDSIPVGGENLGGVKNGGNVVIHPDGTMTAPVSDSSQTVNPVAKTEEMTQPVGVDENGQLYTAPGGGGGANSIVIRMDIGYTNDGDEYYYDNEGSASVPGGSVADTIDTIRQTLDVGGVPTVMIKVVQTDKDTDEQSTMYMFPNRMEADDSYISLVAQKSVWNGIESYMIDLYTDGRTIAFYYLTTWE